MKNIMEINLLMVILFYVPTFHRGFSFVNANPFYANLQKDVSILTKEFQKMYRCAYNAKVKLFERNISLQNNSHSLNDIFCCILLHEIHREHFTSLWFGVQDMRWRYYDGFTKLDKTSYYSDNIFFYFKALDNN